MMVFNCGSTNGHIGNKQRKFSTMGRNEKTSKKIGKLASKILRDKRYSKTSKRVAGSALTQRPDKKKK